MVHSWMMSLHVHTAWSDNELTNLLLAEDILKIQWPIQIRKPLRATWRNERAFINRRGESEWGWTFLKWRALSLPNLVTRRGCFGIFRSEPLGCARLPCMLTLSGTYRVQAKWRKSVQGVKGVYASSWTHRAESIPVFLGYEGTECTRWTQKPRLTISRVVLSKFGLRGVKSQHQRHQCIKTCVTTRQCVEALPELENPIINISDLHCNDNLTYHHAGGSARCTETLAWSRRVLLDLRGQPGHPSLGVADEGFEEVEAGSADINCKVRSPSLLSLSFLRGYRTDDDLFRNTSTPCLLVCSKALCIMPSSTPTHKAPNCFMRYTMKRGRPSLL